MLAEVSDVYFDEDTVGIFEILANDIDGDQISYSIIGGNNIVTSITDNIVTFTPIENFSGSESFTIIISDSFLQDSQGFIVTFNNINDSPLAQDENIETNEDQDVVIILSGTDIDNDILSYSIVQDPTNGTLDINGNIAIYTPLPNESGLIDSFVYRVSDGDLFSDGTINVAINEVNDSPIIELISDQQIDEDSQLSYPIVAYDYDQNDIIDFSVYTSTVNVTSWIANGVLNILPDANWFGIATITVTVSDGLLSSSTSFIVEVLSVNDVPVIYDENITINEDSESLIILSAEDIDSYNLTYSIISNPNYGTASLNAAFLTYVPNENSTQTDSIVYIVNDGDLNSNEAYIIYNIEPINDPPELPYEFINLTINEDEQYIVEIPIYDVDNDLLDYTIDIINENATYEIINDLLIITPALNYYGQISVSISVTDGVYVDSDIFTIDIISVNDTPEIISVPISNLFINQAFEYIIEVNDPDDDDFIFELSNEPEGMIINENIISWTPYSTGLFGPIEVAVTDMNLDNPQTGVQEFYLDVRLSQDFTLHSGNNLISYLGVLEDASIENMLFDLSSNVTQISTENYAAIQQEDGTWVGSLNYIEPTKGYWIRLNENDDYGVATYQTTINQTYSLHMGWNLISYIGDDATPLDDALPDDIELLFTDIMSENIVAMRDENGEWVGTLANIGWQNLKGYWVYVSEDIEFSYENNGSLPRLANNIIPEYNISEVIDFSYEQSQSQTFYYFKDIKINNNSLTKDDWIIAYHNDVIVGSRKWFGEYTDVPTMGYDGFDETLGYCVNDSKITFKVYQHSTGKLIDMDGEIPEWKNQKNFVVNLLTEKVMLPTDYNISNPYPNPFNPIVKLDFSIPIMNNVKVQIYDIQGRLVEELLNNTKPAGTYQIKWSAEKYASGIYFMHIISGEFTDTKKITLLK